MGDFWLSDGLEVAGAEPGFGEGEVGGGALAAGLVEGDGGAAAGSAVGVDFGSAGGDVEGEPLAAAGVGLVGTVLDEERLLEIAPGQDDFDAMAFDALGPLGGVAAVVGE